MEQSTSWELTGLQLVKKFPTFYGTCRFITAFTSACHLSLSWTSSIQSTPPYPTSWRSVLILSSFLRLGLPIDLSPSGFPTKTLYTPLLLHIRYMPRPSHSSQFIIHTILGEEYRTLSSSLCSFLHSPITSSLLGPNILISILFSYTLTYVPPSMSVTKFHTHTKQQAKFHSSVYLNL